VSPHGIPLREGEGEEVPGYALAAVGPTVSLSVSRVKAGGGGCRKYK
jgi:hypothetical protein